MSSLTHYKRVEILREILQRARDRNWLVGFHTCEDRRFEGKFPGLLPYIQHSFTTSNQMRTTQMFLQR